MKYMKPRVLPYVIRAYNTGKGVDVQGFRTGYTKTLAIPLNDWILFKLIETVERA